MKRSIAGFIMCVWLSSAAFAAPVKNIILMISDGQGYNTVYATELFEGKPAVYESFPVKLSASTFSASNDFNSNPLGYDPAKAWSDFLYVTNHPTDSAAAATALNTGIKVYDGRLNWSIEEKPLKTFAQYAAEKGMDTGAITTVPLSHATPAGVAAHNVSRENYSDIAKEMIYKSDLDVIMGCGHPRFDNSGNVDLNPDYNYVGGEDTWKDITDADGANGFKFIETKEDFEKLANGELILPKKVLGVPQARATLQESRIKGNPQEVHSETFNKNVPDLATMSVGALRVLHQNPKGFYLMIEGGAIDWANHGNLKGRVIEEQMDFNKAVQAVVDWVEKNSNWNETLLIVTADHETGLIWGANDHFAPLPFSCPGQIPGMVYNSTHHTNSLVPVYAKGAQCDLLKKYATGFDPIRGQFMDNTDIFNVMFTAIGNPAPEKKWPNSKKNTATTCATQPAK